MIKNYFTMHAEEEAYREYIVVSEDEESEKENAPVKKSKTKKEQFDLMIAFAKDCNEETIDKETYNIRWDQLAEQLNEIGTPSRSVTEWRRVWSIFKYNRKRKVDSIDHASRSRQEDPSQTVFQPAVQSSVLTQLLVKLTGVLQKLEEIIHRLDKTNLLLEQIAKKP